MDFSVQINEFQTSGKYDYKFDEVGNVMVNSSSMIYQYNYIGLPLMDVVYDDQSVESYYDLNFTEFIPVSNINESDIDTEQLSQSNQELIQENTELKSKINTFIKLSESDSSVAESDSIKRVILDLRIALKQGEEDREFSDTFPYTPKNVD